MSWLIKSSIWIKFMKLDERSCETVSSNSNYRAETSNGDTLALLINVEKSLKPDLARIQRKP